MMKIGLFGLGKMGVNIALNAMDHGYQIIGFDKNKEKLINVEKKGISVIYSIDSLINELSDNAIIWIMINAGDPVDQVLTKIAPLL